MAKNSNVEVGWYLDVEFGDFIFPSPKSIYSERNKMLSLRAVQACPAVNELEKRIFSIGSPFHLHLELEKQGDRFDLFSIDGTNRLDDDLMGRFVTLMKPEFWRNPQSPVIQIASPYIFFSDENVYITQTAPHLHEGMKKWPGVIISGRYQIQSWLRPLNWAFEWTDTSKPLRIKQGEPLYYCTFETSNPDSGIDLFRAKVTDEVIKMRDGAKAAPKFTSNTFKIFKTAFERRPKKILEREDK